MGMVRYYLSQLATIDMANRDDDGNYQALDWDATLYVEVYDSADVLQDTFTTSSNPAITTPNTGRYQVAGIDISGYATGVAYSHWYGKKGAVAVQPYPYIEFCFQILEVPSVGYSAAADVRSKLYDVSTDEIDASKVALAIQDAYNVINGKIGGRYTVPFSSPYPKLIVTISDALAVCYAREYHSETVEGEEETADPCKQWKDMLEEIAVGEVALPEVAMPVISDSSTRQYSTIFNLDDEKNHRIDPDQADAIADTRD